jgi:DNA-binding IclR family transcriptional regulator
MAKASRTNGKGRSRAHPGNGSREESDGATPTRDYSIAAVSRALDLLEALSRIGPAPLAALADTARCTRTAGFRLLRTLEARGFALQDEARGMWRLGARWGVLGRAAVEQGALAATAMPFLAALGKASGENTYLRVRDGLESETTAIYQTDPGLRIYSEVGKRQPLHAGSGRLLLAHAPEAVQTQVLAQRLPRFTPATRTDPVWIAADLQRIRARGYLLTTDEVVAGAASVAAPVRDGSGQVVAVLSVTAPTMRMRPPRPRALLPPVLDAAMKLSRALGAPTGELTAKLADPARKGAGAAASGRDVAPAASVLASAGPHSILR